MLLPATNSCHCTTVSPCHNRHPVQYWVQINFVAGVIYEHSVGRLLLHKPWLCGVLYGKFGNL